MTTTHAVHAILPAVDAAAIDADIAALDAHTAAIETPWKLAFRGPAVSEYQTGAHVWLFDHYNTAVVVGPGPTPGRWMVSTLDADGHESTLCYREVWLRPALEPRVFTWPRSTN